MAGRLSRLGGVAVVLACLVCVHDAVASLRDLEVRVGGQERRYRLFTPDGVASARGVVVAFHGGGQDEAQMAAMTRFDEIGQRHGWAVAYPRSIGGHWNSRACCAAGNRAQNDVAFFDALLGDLRARGLPVRRTSVTGFSDGGFFALRLACERAARLHAVAVVGATMVFRPCRPEGRLLVTTIWGERDRRVPPSGRELWFRLPGARAVSRFWRRANGCAGVSRSETPVLRTEVATRCHGGGYVAHVMRGGGHGWPLGPPGVNAGELVADALGLSR